MLKACFGQLAVQLEARGPFRQVSITRLTDPHCEMTLLGNRDERVIAFGDPKQQFLPRGLPAKFLDEKLGKVAVLQKSPRSLKVEWHRYYLSLLTLPAA